LSHIGVKDPSTVVPTNLAEKIARGAGEGVGRGSAPEAVLAGLGKLGVVGEKATEILGQLFGKAESVGATATNAAAGGAGGAGAVAAEEAAPEPLKPLAATLGGLGAGGLASVAAEVPNAVRTAAKIGSDFVAPVTQGGRERLAGEQLVQAADSPGAVKEAIQNRPEGVPGSEPTTGQLTGDMGLLSLERAAATKPRGPEVFNQRRADQNAARVGAVEDIQKTGAPEQVVTAVRDRVKAIDDAAEADVLAAADAARAKTSAVGDGTAPDVAGDAMRQHLEAARAAAKDKERVLWKAVDPDGKLTLGTAETKAAQARIFDEVRPTEKPVEGEEKGIFDAAANLPETAPFSDLTALQSRIKTEMRAERFKAGESQAYRRLTILNQAVQKDLETAVAEKTVQEQKAVDAGQMRPEDTIAARLNDYANDYLGIGQAQPLARGGDGGVAPSAAPAERVPGVRGTAGEARDGSPAGGRDQGVSVQPNLDRAALDRLNEARGATKERVETFDNKTLSPIRRRPGTTSPYDMSSSAVPGRIFYPGPKSADSIATYRKAVGDGEAMSVLESYAVDRLRRVALRDDGTLDPAKLARWRLAHSDGLKAFPELDAKLKDASIAGETMAEAAVKAKQIKAENQKGSIGKILGAEDPEEVVRVVGSIFGRKDSAREMAKLRMATQGNPEALEGLRKAVVDFIVKKFVSNTEAATSGVGTIKSDAFQTFMRESESTLTAAGFKPHEIATMKRVAADLRQANRSITAVKLPGGSNTTQDVLATKANEPALSMFVKILLASGATGVGSTVLGGAFVGVPATLAAALFGVLRQHGIRKIDDLVREALLNPDLAHTLMAKVKPAATKQATVSLTQRLARSAVAGTMAVTASP
jgi:hypothetical protein